MSKKRASQIARELGIQCKQAFYSEWGNYYMPITEFPCLLCDESGFILISNSDDLLTNDIKVGKRTNVRHRISSLPGYRLFSTWIIRLPEEIPSEVIEPSHTEGLSVSVLVNRFERDRQARAKCLDYYGYTCQACRSSCRIHMAP